MWPLVWLFSGTRTSIPYPAINSGFIPLRWQVPQYSSSVICKTQSAAVNVQGTSEIYNLHGSEEELRFSATMGSGISWLTRVRSS
jgi:hypothetical protein